MPMGPDEPLIVMNAPTRPVIGDIDLLYFKLTKPEESCVPASASCRGLERSVPNSNCWRASSLARLVSMDDWRRLPVGESTTSAQCLPHVCGLNGYGNQKKVGGTMGGVQTKGLSVGKGVHLLQ